MWYSCSDKRPPAQGKSAFKNESSINGESVNHIIITKRQFDSSHFEIGGIEERAIEQLLPVTGEIHLPPRSKASVSTYLEGSVKNIKLLEGQWVAKGQQLFTVRNPSLIDLQESYLIASGELQYLSTEFERQNQLFKKQISLKKDLLKIESELRTTKARVAAMYKKLSLYGLNPAVIDTEHLVTEIAISAPISGYISTVDVVEGQYLEASTSAVSIVNTSQMHLELKILEKDIYKLSKDQKVTFFVQGAPDKEYETGIHLIQKELDDQRMVQIDCDLNSETEKNLVAGMFVSAFIHIGSHTGWAIVEEAVVHLDGDDYVLEVIEENEKEIHLKAIKIIAEESEGGYRELKLEAEGYSGKRFLTKGAYYIMEAPNAS